MAYQTFALKYRPQTFDEIIGQDHVATTLKHALSEGRVAHGYLFAGPRGTGKTSTARVLAKALNCDLGPTPSPCCECPMCEAIASGNALDLVEIDAASNRGIDDIRELRSRVGYAPTQARCKFYILDEAHMLTNEASNALLKTLEEPPDHVYFVLATTELHNILPTIRSRCQSFEFRPIPQVKIVEALRGIAENEGVRGEEAALGAIARAAGGAMRDAESIFDQVIAYGRGEVTLEVVNSILGVTDADLLVSVGDAVARNDIEGVFRVVDEVVAGGRDIGQLLEDLALYFRDLLRISLGANPPEWMQSAAGDLEEMQQQAGMMGPRRLGAIIEELGEASARIRDTSQKPLLLEVTLAHLAAADGEQTAGSPVAAAETDDATAGQESQTAGQKAVRAKRRDDEASRDDDEKPAADRPADGGAAAEEASAESGESAAEQSADESRSGPVDAPPASDSHEPLSIDDVQTGWPRVLEVLTEGGHAGIAAVISRAQPVSLDDERLSLCFPADAEFEVRRTRDAWGREVTKALERVCGRGLEIFCELAAPPGEAADEAQESASSSEDEQEKMIEALKFSFDGSEEIEPN